MTRERRFQSKWPTMNSGVKKQQQRMWSETCRWVTSLAETTSLHGIVWYTRTNNRGFKTLICILSAFIILGLPTILVIEFVEFYGEPAVLSKIDRVKNSNVTYPNITICHPGYFDYAKMEEYGVSHSLGNYMLMVMNPAVRRTMKFMEENMDFGEGQGVFTNLRQLALVLQAKMEEYQFTELNQLYKALAIDCNELITFCSVHNEFFVDLSFPGSNESVQVKNCCDGLFHREPIFNFAGTCYSTKKEIIETEASLFSSISFWLNAMPPERNLQFDMNFHGSNAAERGGFSYILSTLDTPSAICASNVRRVPTGTVHVVGLEKSIYDRTDVRSQSCAQENGTFEDIYAIPKTYANCQVIYGTVEKFPNCSLASYLGLKKTRNVRDCLPYDILETEHKNIVPEVEKVCPDDCQQVTYAETQASSEMLGYVLDNFQNQMGSALPIQYDGSRASVLQFYFKTLDSVKFISYQEGLLDFLSKVGGWMGLAFGASIISFIEIFGFIIFFWKTIFRALTGNK